MTEERYLQKLVSSYEEIIDLQREKIKNLEKELMNLKKDRPVEDIFKNRYDWSNEEKENVKETTGADPVGII